MTLAMIRLALSAALLLAACQSGGPPVKEDFGDMPTPISDGPSTMGEASPYWRLVSVDGDAVSQDVFHTLRIDDIEAGGVGQMHNGCHTAEIRIGPHQGGWRLARTGIATDGVNRVRVGCAPASAISTKAQAEAVARAYDGLDSDLWTFELDGNRVTLTNARGGTAVLERDTGALDLRPLYGKPLYLAETPYYSRDEVAQKVTALSGDHPYLKFGPTSVSDFDGCNTASGRYLIAGQRLYFDDVRGTEIGCGVQALMRPPDGIGVHSIYMEPRWTVGPGQTLRVSSVSANGDTVYDAERPVVR